MVDTEQSRLEIENATLTTAANLKTIAANLASEQISELSLPEVEEVANAVARVIPAGNVPGLIASGLARIQGNAPTQREVKRDIRMLFSGMKSDA